MSDVIEYHDKGLKNLIKAFKNIPKARVGVLGSKDNRTDGNENAKIGAIHEFGEGDMPMRSFLRIPIAENLQRYLEESGAFTADALKKIISEASLRVWVGKIGVVGERIVQDAFDTGGFGKWQPSNMKNKTVQMTLVETQQLRRSIASEVEGA